MASQQTDNALTAGELLQRLFSYPAMLDLLAEDVEWHLPASLWEGVGGAHVGRPAVEKMLGKVMTEFYVPEKVAPEVLATFATDTHATIILIMNAETRWGQTYRNRYAITIESAGGKISKVYEVFDTKNLYDTLDNTKFG